MEENKVQQAVVADDMAGTGYKQELNRVMGLKDLIISGLVYVIPIAPIAIFGYVHGASNGMVPTTYFIGVVAIFFTALAYAAFAKKWPIAGSAYGYIQRAINPHVGFIFGWLILLDYVFMPGFCYYIGATFLLEIWPSLPIAPVVIACGVLICICIIRGIAVTKTLNMILFIFQCAVGAVIMFLCARYVIVNDIGFTIKPFYDPEYFNFGFVTSAVTIAAMSFLGFDGISALSEEVKNPTVNMPRGLIWTVILLGAIFVALTYLGCAVIPESMYADVAVSAGFVVVTDIIDPSGVMSVIVSLTMFIGCGIAACLMNATAATRILYGMGRDGMMPRAFGKVHPKFKSPHIAAICLSIITVAVALIVPNEDLGNCINFGALTTFAMLNVSVIVYFFGKQKQRGAYGFFRYVIVPVIGFTVIAMCWIGFSKLAFIVGFGWMAAGIILGAILSKGYKVVPEAFRNMEGI